MQDRPTTRQSGAWMLAVMTVPAVTLCAGISWQWALLGGAVCAAFELAQRGKGQSADILLRDAANEALGAAGGTLIMGCAAIWNLFALACVTQWAGGALPEAEDPVAVRLILLALAAFAAWKDETVPARCAGVIALVLAGIYTLLLLGAIGEVEAAWLRPWGGWRRALLPMAALLLPRAVHYLRAERGGGKNAKIALLLLGPAAVAALTAGNLSPRLAAVETAPFYEMVKGLSLFSVVERFEPLASAALALGYFCAMTLLLCAARACCGGKRKLWQLAVMAVLAGAGSFWSERAPGAVFAAGAAIFWGVLPLLIPLVVDRKKDGKKSKIMLDKSDSV